MKSRKTGSQMLIRELKLSWFRGAADEAVLNCGGKSVVVYGTNGAGKSSFVDGIEFLLSNGRIRHLAHEYSGHRQERGIRNTHSPEGAVASVLLTFADGKWIQNEIDENGRLAMDSSSSEIRDTVSSWQLEHFVLRQDEVAAFIHATKGEKYSVLLPLLGLHEIEQSASNLRDLRREFEAKSGLAGLREELGLIKSEASESLQEISIEHARSVLKALADDFLREGLPEDLAELAEAIGDEIESRVANAEPAQRLHHQQSQVNDAGLEVKLERLSKAEEIASQSHSQLIDRQITVLESASTVIEWLTPEQESVACPACGRELSVKDLHNHVEDELQHLRDAKKARDGAIQARRNFQSAIGVLRSNLQAQEFADWIGGSGREDLRSGIQQVAGLNIDETTTKWSDESWSVLRNQVPAIASQIEAASKDGPKTTKGLIDAERNVAACRLVPEIISKGEKIEEIEAVVSVLNEAERSVREEIKIKSEATIGQISSEVQDLWLKLHPDEPIENIQLYIPGDADKAIDIGLKFFGVEQPSPRLSLSESHRNSLGLCIFLALASPAGENEHPIVLDDVVSSFDREHRGMVGNLLVKDLSNRQILVFTHDREWLAELRWMLPDKEWEFLVLKPWINPSIGIQWANSAETFAKARELITANPEAAGNRVRAIMDTHMAIAAEKLQISLPYRRGDRNDRRTCIEFLEKVVSDGQSRLKHKLNGDYEAHTAPIAVWEQARSLLGAWANRASHTGSLVKAEAEELANACEAALEEFRCPDCKDPLWISDQSSRKRLQCSCGKLRWNYD